MKMIVVATAGSLALAAGVGAAPSWGQVGFGRGQTLDPAAALAAAAETPAPPAPGAAPQAAPPDAPLAGDYTVVLRTERMDERVKLRVRAASVLEAQRLAMERTAAARRDGTDLTVQIFDPNGVLAWEFSDECGLPRLPACTSRATIDELYPQGIEDYDAYLDRTGRASPVAPRKTAKRRRPT